MSHLTLPPPETVEIPETSQDSGSPKVESSWSLRSIFRANTGSILFVYLLFCLENGIQLLQPLVLGWAINDLLTGSFLGLGVFVGQHLGYLLASSIRRMADTRVFTGIYNRLAGDLVEQQHLQGVDVSRISARTVLSRELVDFFERDLQMLLTAIFSLVGGLAMLLVYDAMLIGFCLLLFVPLYVGNRFYQRWLADKYQQLHDGLEREVDVIAHGRKAEVTQHFHRLSFLRIRLSDGEAVHFGAMELFVLGLLVVALIRSCNQPDATAGSIFAVFRYVLMFVMSLDSVPILVQRLSRVRDIGGRLGGNLGGNLERE